MPQLYYGFNNQYLSFDQAYNNWYDLINNTNVKLIPALAFYKLGSIDNEAGLGKNEWLNEAVITKQINFLKEKNDYKGYGLFRYDYLFNKYYVNEIIVKEIDNFYKNV